MAEPLLPKPSLVSKKYRTGSFLGKIARHISTHKKTRKIVVANMAAVVIAGTFIPSVQAQGNSIQNFNVQADATVLEAQNSLKTQKAIIFPLAYVKINQGFGLFHPGVDLGASIGDSIHPIKAGEVIEAGYTRDGYGNTILIDHGNGMTSRYAHLSKIEVTKGEEVTTNMEIGKVGITGHSTGPHLHLEVRENGVALNPLTIVGK